MRNGLYSKIAISNIRKNYRFFVPRILAEAGLLGCFYISVTLSMDERLSKIKGGEYVPTFMLLGTVVMTILSVVIMIYVNSFLMKQRKKEFGMYNVLGLEKRHIGKILFYENLISSIISIVLGLAVGILFYKLCSLLICRLLGAKILVGFYYIKAASILISAIFYAVTDLITYVINRINLSRLNPAELLASKAVGEREPRVKWLMLTIGILSLGGGYFISITTKEPLKVMGLFFVAVILVIIGTYFLFITGSTFILKILRKNKKYYYSKNHMPAVSGLLYRMKQNAVGLSSIAILSTGVLVMISTTVSLYSGLTKALNRMYPQDMYLSAGYIREDNSVAFVSAEALSETVLKAAKENNITVSKAEYHEYLQVSYLLQDHTLCTSKSSDNTNVTTFTFITEETYKKLTGESLGLGENEIATVRVRYSGGGVSDISDYFTLHGREFRIVKRLMYFPISTVAMVAASAEFGVVVSNDSVLEEIYNCQLDDYGKYASDYTKRIAVTFENREKASAVGSELERSIGRLLDSYRESQPDYKNSYFYDCETYWDTREAFVGMYGTLLFLGIILGTVCLFAAVLIIYYKQISEGYEDRTRFQIMQKIGMSKDEVRKTISSQILIVFFLPLLVSGIHLAFASPILTRLLRILMFDNPMLFVFCTLGTFAVFALIYTVIYAGTARTYYKIVQ